MANLNGEALFLPAAETLRCTPGPGSGGLPNASLSGTGGLEQRIM